MVFPYFSDGCRHTEKQWFPVVIYIVIQYAADRPSIYLFECVNRHLSYIKQQHLANYDFTTEMFKAYSNMIIHKRIHTIIIMKFRSFKKPFQSILEKTELPILAYRIYQFSSIYSEAALSYANCVKCETAYLANLLYDSS